MAQSASPFPSLDLYATLDLPSTASQADIKAAYRRAALVSHPDKVPPTASATVVAAANTKFQEVGFAYAVLKDEARRARYDEIGRTDEGSGEGAKTEAEWKDYFRELWSGEINGATIDEFTRAYQGSEEERAELLASYTSSSGDLDTILASIMCSTVDDEDRFISLLNAAIASKEIPSFPRWTKAIKDAKAKEKRRAKATKEATEAEAYARDLGIHDTLFGEGAKKGAAGGKGKGKGKKGDEEGASEDALRALIQGNASKRMETMLDSLEAKYAPPKDKAKKGKKRASAGGEVDEEEGGPAGKRSKKEVEPTEEEFAKIQAEMDARRAGNKSSGEKNGGKTGRKGKA